MYLNPPFPPAPPLTPSLILGSFGSHIGNISWHFFPCFFQGSKVLKKNDAKISGFSAVFDSPPLILGCFGSYFGDISQHFLPNFPMVRYYKIIEAKMNGFSVVLDLILVYFQAIIV